MCELALNCGKAPIAVGDIAKKQQISEKYLSKLVIPLKSAGLIRSSRGSRGGFVLAREPEKITLLEIIKALEGDIVSVECIADIGSCARSGRCPARSVWKKLDQTIAGFLGGISLADIVFRGEDCQDSAYNI
jgi:Rrf2 family protein